MEIKYVLIAGTNSEIEVSKHKTSRKRLNDEIRDIALKPLVKKPKKIDTLTVISQDYEKKPIKQTEVSQTGPSSSSLSDIEREKLRERVRQISMRLGNKEDSKSAKKHKKKKKHKRKKYAKFEGEMLLIH